MRFFDFLKGPDINQGVKEYSTTDSAVLLDVRTPDEYRQGHIPDISPQAYQRAEQSESFFRFLLPARFHGPDAVSGPQRRQHQIRLNKRESDNPR